ncbi:MAG: hypothetical protein U0T32_05865 [Chitinophagales bacterium]
MKKLLFFALVIAGITSLNSCAKCLKCKNSTESQKFCTKNNEDQADLDVAKVYYESNGYKCAISTGSL